MIDMKWPRLSALQECTLLQLNRSGIYYRPVPENRKYPYLIWDLVIDWPNQVWCSDITYIPMRKGFLYLVAIMDWSTRKVLSWRLSNTDQGSQFTTPRFTDVRQIRISMGGRVHLSGTADKGEPTISFLSGKKRSCPTTIC